MLITKISLFILCTWLAGHCFAQQEPTYTMFWNNYSFQNPATAGLFHEQYASISARDQWEGYGHNPKTISFLYERKLAHLNSGVGINYYYDQAGVFMTNTVKLNYSYHMVLDKHSFLSTGLSAGLMQQNIDLSQISPLLASGMESSGHFFDISMGAMFKSNRFVLGFGVTHLNQPRSSALHSTQRRHNYLTCSYIIALSPTLDIKPGVYFKSDGPLSVTDFNLLVTFNQRFWSGITYRKENAVALMVGADLKGKYRIGYSYDYITSNLRPYTSGSHEVVLAWILDERNWRRP